MTEAKTHQLKGAHYSEEPKDASSHAFSVLVPLEGGNGFVFGVIHSLGSKESFDAFSGIVANHLERLSATVDPGANLTHRFEQLLQAVNEEIATAVDDGAFALPINDTSSVIGIANETTVVVSGFGNLLAEFMHKSEKERFDIYDLSRGMRVEEEVPSWKKPYLTVLDGELASGDVLFVGTRVSRHDLPATTLNEIITTLPPNSAVSKIRQYLPIETVFGAVILKADRFDEPALKSDSTAHSSIERLDKTKATTDQFLSDQKPEVKSMAMKLWLLLFPKRGSNDRRKLMKRFFRFLWRIVLVFLTVAGQILIGLFLGVFQLIKRMVSNPKQVFGTLKRGGGKMDQSIRRSIERFNTLPKASKYILLGFLMAAFLLIAGIVLINREQTNAAERRAYEESISSIEGKLENAEASLIYGDESQARMLLNDASELVAVLAVNTEERKRKAEELASQISTKRDVLRHLVNVEVKQVADASGLTGTTMSAIIPFDGTLYGVTSNGDIYTIDAANESLVKVEVTKGEVGTPIALTTSDEAVYWLDDGLSRYIPSSSEVSPLSVSRKGVDLAYYGGKMYILSPDSGQIYKHQRTATGFDGGSAWVISSVSSLSGANALAIDGYVWVLKVDGSILRYLAGKETDWKVTSADPDLLNATDIWTNESSKFLYVLDPTEGRVVVFNKENGALVTQYANQVFKGANSMIVDEATRKITILSGNKVYQFESQN